MWKSYYTLHQCWKLKGVQGFIVRPCQYKIINVVKIFHHKVSSLRGNKLVLLSIFKSPDIFWRFLLYLDWDVKSNDNKLPKLGDYLDFIDLIYLSNQINKNHFLSRGSISASNGANLVWTNQYIELNSWLFILLFSILVVTIRLSL